RPAPPAPRRFRARIAGDPRRPSDERSRPPADPAIPRLARRAPARLRRDDGRLAHLVPAAVDLGERAARRAGQARARRGVADAGGTRGARARAAPRASRRRLTAAYLMVGPAIWPMRSRQPLGSQT